MKNSKPSATKTVTVRCDRFGGLTIYSGSKRVSNYGLTPSTCQDELAEMGIKVEFDELILSEGNRVTFAR